MIRKRKNGFKWTKLRKSLKEKNKIKKLQMDKISIIRLKEIRKLMDTLDAENDDNNSIININDNEEREDEENISIYNSKENTNKNKNYERVEGDTNNAKEEKNITDNTGDMNCDDSEGTIYEIIEITSESNNSSVE